MKNKKLYRSLTERKICGVCGGIAKYLEIDPTAVRIVYILITLFTALWMGIIAYFIMAIIMPDEPVDDEPNPPDNE